MFRFLRDLIIYPFDSHKETNKFASFLKMIFKDYPAFLWIKPNFRKIIAFPFLMLFYVFKNKTSNK
ncbi:MAG: hypothetical protein WC010_01560 [Candidatus Absconditabacterales bacterium]